MVDLAIVTGGGTGIGRALARALSDRGLDVLVVGRREGPLAETCAHAPARMRAVPADVATQAGRQRVVDASGSDRVRCLVHNAGVLEPIGPLAEVAPDAWRTAQAINVDAPLFLTQALLPVLSGGRVLHMSSGAAHGAYAGWGSYCVSKAALHMLYQVLREELAPRGIAVGSMRPGVVDTPMQALIRQQSPDRFPRVQRFVDLHATGALESPADVAAFATWLMLDVTVDDYVATEWSITEPEQRRRWEQSR